MPDTGTIENTQEAGRKAMIVTHEGTDILNSFNMTIDPPDTVIVAFGADAQQHVNIQAVAPGEATIEVTGTGSGPHVGLVGEILVTVTAGGGGGNPGGLTITLGPALPKL
jgi:hypothetical protein